MRKIFSKKYSNKGFSLLEMIVALGLFSVGALIAVGGFLSVISASKKAQTTKTSINSINYMMEGMLREMRLGNDYYCANSASTAYNTYVYSDVTRNNGSLYGGPSNDATLAFITNKKLAPSYTDSIAYVYRYTRPSDDGLTYGYVAKAECSSASTCSALTSDSYTRITPENTNITSMYFKCGEASNSLPDDDKNPPYLKVYVKGVSGDKLKEQTEFNLESLVTPRI